MAGEKWRYLAVVCLCALSTVGRTDDVPSRARLRGRLRAAEGDAVVRPFDSSVVEPAPLTGPSRFAAAVVRVPPPSPGVPIAFNWYDYQGSDGIGRHVGRNPGADIVHFAWMQGQTEDGPPFIDRYVAYAAYSASGNNFLADFVLGTAEERHGYPDLSIDSGNQPHIGYHAYPSTPYKRLLHAKIPWPSWSSWTSDTLFTSVDTCDAILWPRIAVQDLGGMEIIHELAVHNFNSCPGEVLSYWRFDGVGWDGPAVIDSSDALSYRVVADHNSSKCALILNPTVGSYPYHHNVAYYESQTGGAGWLSGAELGTANKHFITNYVDHGPQAWPDMSAAYDHDGNLHVVYLEQTIAPSSGRMSVKHWDKSSGLIHSAATANWETYFGPWSVQVALGGASLGIGDGTTACNGGSTTNRNYLYVTYSAFGGNTSAEYNDMSYDGYYNGELYLVASADGANWSTPQNLTNTKTPNCSPGTSLDSLCRSEVYGSIGENVSDIDILYLSDLDAGAAVQGEGTWQPNLMMYLRFPGGTTDALYLCPPFLPQFGAALDTVGGCGLYAQPGKTDTTVLHLSNAGNMPLNGKITITYAGDDQCAEPWVEVEGRMDTLSYTVAAGDLDTVFQVILHGDTLPGLLPARCTAILRITHNDPSQTSPFEVTVPFAISPCLCHADPQCDHVTDILDVVKTIGVAFRGELATTDNQCPFERTDVDCSGASDVLDVVHMTNVAFRGQGAATEFCHPCP